MYAFRSAASVIGYLPDFSEEIVKNEPMLFSADPEFAYANGGMITRSFLKACEKAGFFSPGTKRFCIDTRVHMLMPGWWPCIPGWHHDDVPRNTPDGQPNYTNPPYRPKHALAFVGGDICPTEFAIGEALMPIPTYGIHTTYKLWDPVVESLIERDKLLRWRVPDRALVMFDDRAFHQGTQAIARGWRWFGRITWDADYENGRPHMNEIRRQVNVYMTAPKEGW